MQKLIYSLALLLFTTGAVQAQESIYPTKEYKGRLFITNGTIHIGNGQVIENGTVEVNEGKIVNVGTSITVPASGAKVVNAQGKQVYPGLILSSSDLGLIEISSGVRGSNDAQEIGDLNPSVRSIVAYNSDSKFINVLKAQGILLAGVTPKGGTISGSSSVVQTDAWNWEDAAYKMDGGIHMNMPSFFVRPGSRRRPAAQGPATDPVKEAQSKVDELKEFFTLAKAYTGQADRKSTNLKLQAVQGLYDKKQKLYVHADQVKQMLVALDFVKDFGFDVVIVGGSESYLIADLLKQHNVSVILSQSHSLPTMEDDDVDQPYKTPAMLQQAGVLFSINDEDVTTRYRNLSYNAGTAATYGLTKEQALQAITLNAAKILGIDDKTGSLEAGKDANIIISNGDILDMKSSRVEHAFIQGREVSLENKQSQLYERYKQKYGIN